jgi:MYXO-CTERM domain-containing protein
MTGGAAHAGFDTGADRERADLRYQRIEIHTVQESTVSPLRRHIAPPIFAHTVQEEVFPIPDPLGDRPRGGRSLLDGNLRIKPGPPAGQRDRWRYRPEGEARLLRLRPTSRDRAGDAQMQLPGPPTPAPGAIALLVLAGLAGRRRRRSGTAAR